MDAPPGGSSIRPRRPRKARLIIENGKGKAHGGGPHRPPNHAKRSPLAAVNFSAELLGVIYAR